MYEFTYRRAASTEDATAQYNEADDARYLAGGMSLLPTLKLRLDQASDLVDLGHLKDMRGITEENGCIIIKAVTPHAEVNGSDLVQQKIPALAKLAGSIGDPLVRNRGTIGGSLANNDPSADYPSGTLALGATVHTDRRTITADDFFKGLFETALEEGELITQVSFPIPERAGYGRLANPASRFPLVGVFVAQTENGPRVAVTGAGPYVFRVTEMETALAKKFAAESLDGVTVSANGLNEDIHATATYRAHLINVLARRAVIEALG
jgi:aerobic carbon-monoxide dehydrogenase medium subunit